MVFLRLLLFLLGYTIGVCTSTYGASVALPGAPQSAGKDRGSVAKLNKKRLAGTQRFQDELQRRGAEVSSPKKSGLLGRSKKDLEAWLKNAAETEGLGYKTANLRLLQDFAGEISLTSSAISGANYKITVPEFVGVSSKNVQDFLIGKGVDLETQWNGMIRELFKDDTEKTKALQEKKIPVAFWDKAAALEQSITNAFNPEQAKEDFAFNPTFKTNGMDELIELVRGKNNKLMIRSTGREDTDKVANAGGNESVANVNPNTKDVLESMAIVVASYLSHKSLAQRLESEDVTIFDVPFTPLLVQRMAGENRTKSATTINAIPVGGVMFTEETEGGISKLQPRDAEGVLQADPELKRVKTSGITRIDASYGHNEGVVMSTVAVDSYFVISNAESYSIVKPKTFRLAPSATPGKLERVDNPPQLVLRSCLSKNALRSLKRLASLLEAFYRKPMDVEFVIDDQEHIIYIVQARPIVHPRGLKPPNYISDLSRIPAESKVKAAAIGTAGGSARKIVSPMNVIAKTSIGDALAGYLDPKTPKGSVQCIIIDHAAPATGHEATSFRTFAKPIVCTDDSSNFNTIHEWIRAGRKLLVDVQQGVIVDVTVLMGSDDSLPPGFLTQGTYNYPAPECLSLLDYPIDTTGRPISTLSLAEALGQVRTWLGAKILNDNERAAISTHATEISKLGSNGIAISSLMTTLKQGPFSQAHQALLEIVGFIAAQTDQKLKGSTDRDIEKTAVLLLHYLVTTANNVMTYLQAIQGSDDYPRRLLAIRFLRALFYQQQKGIESGYSFAQLFKTIGQEKKLEKILAPDTATAPADLNWRVQFAKLGNLTFTDTTKTHWEDMIRAVPPAAAPETFKNLGMVVKTLSKLDMLGIWMTVFASSAEATIDGLTQACLEPATAEFLQRLCQQKETMDNFNPNLFEDPKKFDPQIEILHQLFIFFTSTDFTDGIRRGGISLAAAISLMRTFVDMFDLAIKSLKSSSKYASIDDKLARFKLMLNYYGSMMISWVMLIKPTELHTTKADIARSFISLSSIVTSPDGSYAVKRYSFPPTDRSAYVAELVSTYKEKAPEAKEQLLNSSQLFVVQAAALGATVKKYRRPETHEDYFTFFHQSLLYIISVLCGQLTLLIAENTVFPSSFAEYTSNIGRKMQDSHATTYTDGSCPIGPPTLIGVTILDGSICYEYNCALREHSARLSITFVKTTKSVEISCYLFGGNEYNRWEKIADFIDAGGCLYRLEHKTNLTQTSVTCLWKLAGPYNDTSLNNIVTIIRLALGCLSYATEGDINVQAKEACAFLGLFPLTMPQENLDRATRMLIKLSLSKKERVHWYVAQLLDRYLTDKTFGQESEYINKILTILKKLCDEKDQGYGITTDLFDFKNQHSAVAANVTSSTNKDMESRYYELVPTVNGFYAALRTLERDNFWNWHAPQLHTLDAVYRRTAKKIWGILDKHKNVLLNETQKGLLENLQVQVQEPAPTPALVPIQEPEPIPTSAPIITTSAPAPIPKPAPTQPKIDDTSLSAQLDTLMKNEDTATIRSLFSQYAGDASKKNDCSFWLTQKMHDNLRPFPFPIVTKMNTCLNLAKASPAIGAKAVTDFLVDGMTMPNKKSALTNYVVNASAVGLLFLNGIPQIITDSTHKDFLDSIFDASQKDVSPALKFFGATILLSCKYGDNNEAFTEWIETDDDIDSELHSKKPNLLYLRNRFKELAPARS